MTRWLGGRSERGAQQHAEKGLVAFFEGRWEAAEKTLRKSLPADQRRLLQSLFAVLATHRRGQRQRALVLLDQLESENKVPQDLVSMVRAECHIEAGEWPLAAGSLDALSLRRPPYLEYKSCEQSWPMLEVIGPQSLNYYPP